MVMCHRCFWCGRGLQVPSNRRQLGSLQVKFVLVSVEVDRSLLLSNVCPHSGEQTAKEREGGGRRGREGERESESGELSQASACNLNRQPKKGKRAGKPLSEMLLDYLWVHRGERCVATRGRKFSCSYFQPSTLQHLFDTGTAGAHASAALLTEKARNLPQVLKTGSSLAQ